MLVRLDRRDPLGPPASLLRLRPPSIGFQHAVHPDHPRRELNINKGDATTKEKWACCVCGIDDRGDLSLEFFGVADLVRLLLRLEIMVESWDDVTVDLDGKVSIACEKCGVDRYTRGRTRGGNARGL